MIPRRREQKRGEDRGGGESREKESRGEGKEGDTIGKMVSYGKIVSNIERRWEDKK